jgi:hypothetical protein
MPQTPDAPRFDLEERSYEFAKQVRAFVKRLPRTVCNQKRTSDKSCVLPDR